MNLKKYMVLIIGCGIALLLAIAAAVLLFQQMSANGRAQAELKAALSKLDQLNKRQPYPNQANVDLTASSLASLKAKLLETQNRVRGSQVEPEQIEPAQFGPLLEKTSRQLKQEAASAAVALPENFAFGFGSYTAGAQPLSNAIPRLVIQVKTVAALTRIMYAARVTNILAISRDEFEEGMNRDTPAAGAAASGIFRTESRGPSSSGHAAAAYLRDIPEVPSNELYSVERFALEFSGRENSVWEVLNAFVKGPPFIIIRHLTLDSTTAGAAAAPAAGGRAGTAAAYAPEMFRESMRPGTSGMPSPGGVMTNLLMTSRDDRIVAGREPVRATLVVDVCRFTSGQGEEK